MTVDLISVPGTASLGSVTNGADYAFTNTTVTWTDGDTANKTNVLSVFDNTVEETNETATLLLTNITPNPGAAIGSPGNLLLTIIDNDGTAGIDFDFSTSNGFDAPVYALAQQADGKVLVGGLFGRFNGVQTPRFARLTTNGLLDTNFNHGIDPSVSGGGVFTLAVRSSGAILAGGDFTSIGVTPRQRVAQFLPDGTLDTSFNPLSGANALVLSVAVQSDDKVLVGGLFTQFGMSSGRALVRLNPSGSVDATFNVGVGFDGRVNSLHYYPAGTNAGRILVAGAFSSYKGTSGVNNLARLNSDGSLDSTFASGTGPNGHVLDVAVLPDGKIVIGGSFDRYNGVQQGRLARLNADGSLDTTFTPVVDALVTTVGVETNGGIAVGGDFTLLGGSGLPSFPGGGTGGSVTNVNRFVRYNPDGTVDLGFASIGNGADRVVNTVLVQSDQRLIVGGEFTVFNGETNNYIARLNGVRPLQTNSIISIPDVDITDGLQIQIDGEPGRVFRVEASPDLKTWIDIGTVQSGHGRVQLNDVDVSQWRQKYYRAIKINE